MATGRTRAENRAMMTDEIRRLGREHLKLVTTVVRLLNGSRTQSPPL